MHIYRIQTPHFTLFPKDRPPVESQSCSACHCCLLRRIFGSHPPRLFPVQQNVEGQDAQDRVLQIRVLVHEDRDHADIWQEALCPAYNVLFREPHLSRSIQSSIVDGIVISLGQELDCRVVRLLVHLDDSMHNGNVSAFHLEHHNLANSHWLLPVVCEQQQVATMKRRLHATTEHDHNWGLAARDHHQTLPDHQGRGDNHAEAKDLVEELQGKGIRTNSGETTASSVTYLSFVHSLDIPEHALHAQHLGKAHGSEELAKYAVCWQNQLVVDGTRTRLMGIYLNVIERNGYFRVA